MLAPVPILVISWSNISTFQKERTQSLIHDVGLQFCIESNLHGLRHIGEKNRHACECILWAVTFLLSIAAAGLLIAGVWTEYREKPIETVFGARQIGIEDIPFPTITICNANNIRKHFYERYMR